MLLSLTTNQPAGCLIQLCKPFIGTVFKGHDVGGEGYTEEGRDLGRRRERVLVGRLSGRGGVFGVLRRVGREAEVLSDPHRDLVKKPDALALCTQLPLPPARLPPSPSWGPGGFLPTAAVPAFSREAGAVRCAEPGRSPPLRGVAGGASPAGAEAAGDGEDQSSDQRLLPYRGRVKAARSSVSAPPSSTADPPGLPHPAAPEVLGCL